MTTPESNADANEKDELQLPTEEQEKEHFEKVFKSIEYNSSNEIDWEEWSDYAKWKVSDAILLIHGLNPEAYEKNGFPIPPRLRSDGDAVEFFRKIKHWLNVAKVEMVDGETSEKWLAWADKKGLVVHPEFRTMAAKRRKAKDRETQPQGQSEALTDNWILQVQTEAARRWTDLRNGGANPTKWSIKGDLAKWCKVEDVRTTTKINPSADYIYRHALRKWTPPPH